MSLLAEDRCIEQRTNKTLATAEENWFEKSKKHAVWTTSERSPRKQISPPAPCPRKCKEGSDQEENRRIHAQRRAGEISNIVVGWRDAQGKQRL